MPLQVVHVRTRYEHSDLAEFRTISVFDGVGEVLVRFKQYLEEVGNESNKTHKLKGMNYGKRN